MNFRQVHLDFHTSEYMENVGGNFSKEQFQAALKAAHVNSITLFSKCHHGWSYHPTKANKMHPNLKFDLLGAQIEAAHEIGVKTPVYISVGYDKRTEMDHGDWLVRNPQGLSTWPEGWSRLCVNTPYLDRILAQTKEVLENYDADGLFFDIISVYPCYCNYCVKELISRGKDPYDAATAREHAEEVYKNYYTKIRELVDSIRPGLPVFHNGGHISVGRRDLAFANSHLELESLPTGGWGYDHFPTSIAYARNLGLECFGMTGKFHTTWGEFGGFKHPNALRYEAALSIMNGAGCSIGDQLHPDGKFNMATYNMIGEAYKEVEAKEPWLIDAKMVTDIGVFSNENLSSMNMAKYQGAQVGDSDAGVGRILAEGKFLFDIIDLESNLEKYKVLILPDYISIDKCLKEKLDKFIKNGGKILATGYSGLDDDGKFAFDFGADYAGLNGYKPDYFRPNYEMEEYGTTEFVLYCQGHRLENVTGKIHGYRQDPYFNRTRVHFCSHRHTPNNPDSQSCGIVGGSAGIYISWNIFEDYAENGALISKRMVEHALDCMLGKDRSLRTSLPSSGSATLMKQGERYIAHLLYGTPLKRGKRICVIEDVVAVHDVSLEVKLDKKPEKVYLAPQMKEIDFDYKDNVVYVRDITVDNHQMVVFE